MREAIRPGNTGSEPSVNAGNGPAGQKGITKDEGAVREEKEYFDHCSHNLAGSVISHLYGT